MMDMEMNAGLDDDGSEDSEAPSEGSSASSTFCTLEKQYEKALGEIKDNEALVRFKDKYTTLFESLYNAHRTEKELTEKYDALQEEVFASEEKIRELTETITNNNEEIERLNLEVMNTMKRADAAHTREQNAQEVIENLRLNVTQLTQEIAQKNRLLAAGEDSTATKQKEMLQQEKEKLTSEVDTLRERLKNMSSYTDELEKRNSLVGHQIEQMQENLDTQLSEISKERRAKQIAQDEVQNLQEELIAKTDNLHAANSSIQAAADNIFRLESLVKEHKASGEKMQKEINKLSVKKSNLQTDLDNANTQIENLEKDIASKEKQLKETKLALHKMRTEMTKMKTDAGTTTKRLQKLELERSDFEQQMKQALISMRNAEQETLIHRKQYTDKQQQIEVLLREKNILARNQETLGEQIKRLNHQLVVSDYGRRKIEAELDDTTRNVMELTKQLQTVEKEREKHSQTIKDLAYQVEDHISEIKLKQLEISNYKKKLIEAETKYRQQQNLFEAVRAERNAYSKSLVESQDETQDLKNKLSVLSHQIEQLKEDIVTKETNLIKEEFLRNKVEKEKEGIRIELQSARKDASALKREIEKMKEEEKSLRQVIAKAESDIGRHKKDIDTVMNERDIIGTQLVRRNDELSLQYSRIKVLHGTLQRGEVQYNQRLEDIRLLKLEVNKLRTENTLLTKNIENMSDLRQEVFHLNRDLTRERLKVMALEEEVQTPLNIHRWRKLQGSDPSAYELLRKTQILQKRVIKMAHDIIEKEKKIKDTEKLYTNLREVLSQHPGPQVAISLNKTQKALRERGEEMKCLIAELNMYEVQICDYKVDMEKMNNEITDLKKKYYTQKRKLQKSKEFKPRRNSDTMLPVVTRSAKKFCGGGFNMAAPTPRNCFLVHSASR
ncbi:cilia- and flagella-associated protein 58-like [Osmia bicornis bicornis]|uniref:cilia- and flagella-associated protein 58-like n=1 Tax=Osmia bicornis bicornis TaxID=1437191 RepID=UPI001EAF06AA|nr:cilia- and flagella-associated protein 58-like [Osmia bicornis bicornis]